MNDSPLHNWLYSITGSTLQEITDELRYLRIGNPKGYEDLPKTPGDLLIGLMDLQRAGLARVDSEGKWFWCQVPVKAEPQERLLFA